MVISDSELHRPTELRVEPGWTPLELFYDLGQLLPAQLLLQLFSHVRPVGTISEAVGRVAEVEELFGHSLGQLLTPGFGRAEYEDRVGVQNSLQTETNQMIGVALE